MRQCLKIVSLLSVCHCGGNLFASKNEALIWNEVMLEAAVDGINPPPVIARSLAILSVAQYDAINSIHRNFKPYRFLAPVPNPGCSEEATIMGASITVIRSVYNARQSAANKLLKSRLAALGTGKSVTDGYALGVASAKAILEDRLADGSLQAEGRYDSKSGIGEYRESAGADAKLPTPGWSKVKPFCIQAGNAFRPEPVDLISSRYAAAFNDVKRLGGKDSKDRTPEESKMARFWSFGGNTITPAGAWNRIAGSLIDQKELSLEKATRLLALLNIALADSAIAAWDAKYKYAFWRPQDAIRLADKDPNERTTADVSWQSYLPTPNHPSYVSGHSTFSSAAATILASFFGTDQMKFTFQGDRSLIKTVRSYWSFSEAAREAGRSRILGGIHFQFDNAAGLELGAKIGKAVFTTELLPAKG